MNIRYKVLCVGVNNVPGLRKLAYAEKDAKTVAQYFETLNGQAEVTLMTGKNATRENIINWLIRCNAIEKELNVIIFFAGHGSAEKEKNTDSLSRCLWIDSREGKDIKTEDHKIKTTEILNLLDNSDHRLLFIIDACYNFGKEEIPSISINHMFRKFKESERMTSLKRCVIISASAVNQGALEDPQLGHGVLTYYFLQTMAGKYTFFLRKKISFFKFLAVLDKRVRNHRFLTDTGRKATLKMLRENGIMVHWHDTNFEMPVLEPIPLIPDPGKNAFQRTIYRWAHFFTCTRMRRKIHFASGILAIMLLLTYFINISVVRIHFKPLHYTTFHHSLIGSPKVLLRGLKSERLGEDDNKKINLYLFKHNWVNALLPKLDGRGKIILKGYLLGDRFNGISELLMVGFALGDSEGVFYWHPDDVMRLLNLIRWGYLFFDKKEKQAALKLLAKLGKNGKATAGRVFDFKRETHQDLRNVFLEHFYSIDFWEKHVDHFNLYDYLCLIRNKKPAPFLENTLLQGKVERFLRNVSRSLPGSITRITDTNKLPEIYEKVSVLAFLGSPHFQNKASDIFKMSFDPEKVLHLLLICRNFSDRVWLLEQYFKYMQDTAVPLAHWWKLIVDFFEKLSVKERSKIIKIFIDTRLPLIPEGFKSHLFRILEDSDPTIIGLSDWENWIKKHHISPFYTLLSIIKMKHPQIFQLIENNYDYFKEEFSFYLFEILYKINRRKTLQLVKKLYPLSSPKIRLYCAVFLVNKNYREYSPYILEFLREAGNNKHKQDILKRFYGVEALIPIVEANKNFKEELRYLLYDRELFYQLVRLNVRLWPEEVKRIILESKIPYSEGEGIPLLRACEKLPDLYRKKMLIKICEADIDETFRLNADSSLVRHYPGEFLKLAYNREYYRHFFKKTLMAQAYQNLSYKVLRHDLVLNLKDPKPGVNVNRRIDFICEALTKKEARGELNIQDLQHILKEFNRPVERMLLRKLRHHVHKRYFQDGEKDE